jgi:hypothetical protein
MKNIGKVTYQSTVFPDPAMNMRSFLVKVKEYGVLTFSVNPQKRSITRFPFCEGVAFD